MTLIFTVPRHIRNKVVARYYLTFRRKLIYRYIAWLDYEAGPTGFGATIIDIPPPFPKPKLPQFLADTLIEVYGAFIIAKRLAWEMAMHTPVDQPIPFSLN